jgi:hypothetical protein
MSGVDHSECAFCKDSKSSSATIETLFWLSAANVLPNNPFNHKVVIVCGTSRIDAFRMHEISGQVRKYRYSDGAAKLPGCPTVSTNKLRKSLRLMHQFKWDRGVMLVGRPEQALELQTDDLTAILVDYRHSALGECFQDFFE